MSVKHPMVKQYGKLVTKINAYLTIAMIMIVAIIMVLSVSLLARMMIGNSNVYGHVMYGTLLGFMLSIIGHIFITTKNILKIDKSLSLFKIIFSLLIYPIGVWTIQEVFKQK
jgi:hypothetical protein